MNKASTIIGFIRLQLWATIWLAFAATTAFGAEDGNIATSIESKLQALYKTVGPAVVKVMVDETDDRVVAEGVIVSPEGHVLMRRTWELLERFRKQQPLLFGLPDGRQLKGVALGWSDEWCIALAKITVEGPYPHVEIANQTNLSSGRLCVAFEFGRLVAESADTGGNQRELNPHMQIGCVTSVAPRNWFRISSRVEQFPAIFDLNSRLIGITTVKPLHEDSYCTTTDIINNLWADLAAGKNVDVVRLGRKSDGDHRPQDESQSLGTPRRNNTVSPAVKNAVQATVRLRPTGQKEAGWSGVIISRDGLIATCAHHRRLPGESVVVLLPDGRDLPGKILGMNCVADVGLVKITEKASLPYVDLGDSTALRGGDACWLAGFPARRQEREPLLRTTFVADRDDVPWSCTLYTSREVESHGGESGGGIFDAAGRLVAIHEGKNPNDFNRHRRVELLYAHWDYLNRGEAVQVIDEKPLEELTKAFLDIAGDKQSIVAEVLCGHQPRALGTIVRADGLVLTKWSELRQPLTVRLSDGKSAPATIVKFSRAHDLALLKIDAGALSAAEWVDRPASLPGTLVAALLPRAAAHVGVVSHDIRPVPADRGGGLANVKDSSDGVQVADESWSRSFDLPLQKGDVIVSVEGHATPTVASLLALLGDSDHPGKIVANAGDPISVVVRREMSSLNLLLPLSASSWPRPDGESHRCSGFPVVFDTDTPLTPELCGAPLIDLQGHVLGIAIACRRSGQTHVIPAATARRFVLE